MTNYIEIGILALSGVCLLFGLILGAIRGGKRSIGRIVVVALCVVAALLLRETVTNALLQMKVGSQTLQESIISALPQELASLGDVVIMFVKLIASVAVFVLLFVALQFVSAIIITPIVNAILGKSRNKSTLLGMLFGLVQGVAVALVLCIPLNGLLVEVNNVAQLDVVQQAMNGSSTAYASADAAGSGEGSNADQEFQKYLTMLDEYAKSGVSKLYTSLGGSVFDAVSTIKDDGKTYTLSGQIKAIEGAAKMKQAMDKLSNIGSADFDASNIADVKQALSDLNNLPDEAKETIGEVVSRLVEELAPDLPVDISTIDFTEVDFEKEGEVVEKVYNFAEKVTDAEQTITEEDIKDIVKTVADSDIVLPLLETADTTIELNETDKEMAKNAIDELEIEDAQKDTLRKLLGIATSSSAE